MGDLLQYNIYVIQAYGQCELKLQALEKWINSNNLG
jgi:hypothetical protein